VGLSACATFITFFTHCSALRPRLPVRDRAGASVSVVRRLCGFRAERKAEREKLSRRTPLALDRDNDRAPLFIFLARCWWSQSHRDQTPCEPGS